MAAKDFFINDILELNLDVYEKEQTFNTISQVIIKPKKHDDATS